MDVFNINRRGKGLGGSKGSEGYKGSLRRAEFVGCQSDHKTWYNKGRLEMVKLYR